MIQPVIDMASFDANLSDLSLLHSVRRSIVACINFLTTLMCLTNLGWHMAAQIVRLILFHLQNLLSDLDKLADPGRAGGPAGPPPGPPPSSASGTGNLIDFSGVLRKNGAGYSRIGRVWRTVSESRGQGTRGTWRLLGTEDLWSLGARGTTGLVVWYEIFWRLIFFLSRNGHFGCSLWWQHWVCQG